MMKPINNEVTPKNYVSKRKVETVQFNANDKRLKLKVEAYLNKYKSSNRNKLLGEVEEDDYSEDFCEHSNDSGKDVNLNKTRFIHFLLS